MQQFLANLIKFNNPIFKQRVNSQSAKNRSSNSGYPRQSLNNLVWGTQAISDREAMCIYRAIDMAG